MAVPSDSVFSRTLRSSLRALCARHLPGPLFNKFSRNVARRSVTFNMARRSISVAPAGARPNAGLDPTSSDAAIHSSYAAASAEQAVVQPVTGGADKARAREQPSFYAQALYDFVTDDPHQLSMTKGTRKRLQSQLWESNPVPGDLMRIVKTEETGWWAATHASDTRVGWIPKDFVRPLRPVRRPAQRT